MVEINLNKGQLNTMTDQANARFHHIIWFGCACVIVLMPVLTYLQG